MSAPPLPSCFDAYPPEAAAYSSEGEWKSEGTAAPYRITPRFWSSIGSRMNAELPQHYGKCDDAAAKPGGPPPRTMYRWHPNRCTLQPFDRSGMCRILGGKQVVVVGDSTVFQTFLSLVLMLGGRFGRDLKHGFVIADLTASACNDTTRIVFVRSDLLLWTHALSDYHAVQRCDGFTILHPFIQRASRDADIVLLGVGHHFPRSLMLAEKWTRFAPAEAANRARIAFFVRNLNHTLSSLISRRAAWGHTDPATVMLLGTSTPVRGCARFKAPLTLTAALTAASATMGDANAGDVTANEMRWGQYARFNQLAKWLASSHGVSFLDVATPSALRPDGAMGGYWPAGSTRQNDCVHYCLPGVVDTWSTIIYNLLRSSRLQRALAAAAVSPAGGSPLFGRGGPRSRVQHAGKRFLDANSTLWHREKGFSEHFEYCRGRLGNRAGFGIGVCEPLLQHHSWWPFYCWESKDRAAKLGVDYARKYTPWQPPESFD